MTADCGGDDDSDGLPDGWEELYFGSLSHNGNGDADGDGLTNLEEYQGQTNPVVPDSPPGEPLGPSSRRTGLVISEIMYHPNSEGFEFIELYNSEPVSKDLTGFRLEASNDGTVEFDYTFPSGRLMAPGDFVLAPVSGLPGQATLRLYNRWGAVLLEVTYSDDPPWPAQADLTGHSLVLAYPSYGENDPRAWKASERIGGSPGRGETLLADPARSVVINEFLAQPSSGGDSIELYNHSNAIINLDGYHLSNSASDLDKFTIPAGTTIPARGYRHFIEDAGNSFTFDLNGQDGDEIFLTNPAQTKVLDAIRFGPQAQNASTGRYRDGAPDFQRLLSQTPGSANSGLYVPSVIINEIMHHPLSGDDADEYVELRGPASSSVAGWKFVDGIQFTFPAGSTLPASGYLIVAKDPSRYPGITALGPFTGKLSDRSERLALEDASGVLVDEVTYRDGGAWGKWSDGGGSSLDLIDPDSDNRLAANWVDSATPAAAWPAEFVGPVSPLENGAGSTPADHL